MKLFCLCIVIGSAVATSRGSSSDQQVLSAGASAGTKPTNNVVEMVYIRHGQSAGNGMLFLCAGSTRHIYLQSLISNTTHTSQIFCV